MNHFKLPSIACASILVSCSYLGAVSISFGNQPLTGTISSATQSNSYTFSANAKDVADFTMVVTSGKLVPKVTVYNTDGTVLTGLYSGYPFGCSGSTLELNTVGLPTTGTYTVVIRDCSDTNTGSYLFYAQRTNNPTGVAALLFGGQPQIGSIASSAQSNTYSFNANAKDVVDLTMVITSGSLVPKIRVYNPDGTGLSGLYSGYPFGCAGSTLELNTVLLPATGTYTVLVGDCGDTNAGGYTLSAQCRGACPATPSARSGVLSHIAAGGTWTTVITLTNTSPTAFPVSVAFHAEDGSALTLPITITNQGVAQPMSTASASATINPNASLIITTGQLPSTVVGWADISSSGPVNGFAIFRTSSSNSPVSEGTVLLQTQIAATITLPYDNSVGFVMGVALANVSQAPANINATIWDDSGNLLGTQVITIVANGHTSFVLSDQLPFTAGKRGIVQFQSGANGGLAGLGLRFSPDGTFTSVPTM
jgi:hypothetical protein